MEAMARFIAEHALLVVIGLVFAISGLIALVVHAFSADGIRPRRPLHAVWKGVGGHKFSEWFRLHAPLLHQYLHRRFSPIAYLSLHAIVGLVILVAAVALFSELIEDVWEQDEVVTFDITLVKALQEQTTVFAVRVFAIVTRLGDAQTIIVIGLLVAFGLLWRRRYVTCLAWAVTLSGGGLLNRLLKGLIQRERPEVLEPLLVASGWAFPSGHAMGAIFTFGMLAYILLRQGTIRRRMPLIVLTVALVLFIGASRIVLQVHYFTDVVAGFAAGIAWLIICITGTELALRRFEGR
jgi:membrane-associated phospholipid phosphatase